LAPPSRPVHRLARDDREVPRAELVHEEYQVLARPSCAWRDDPVEPDALASQVRQASEAAQQQGRRELTNAVQRVDAAGADLERLAERQRTGRGQVRQLAIMTAVGAVAGVIVWVCFSGPIARALPAAWSVPERMAAAALRLDRWDAGTRLMQSASPEDWARIVEASDLGGRTGRR
jgi:hypothetical protein